MASYKSTMMLLALLLVCAVVNSFENSDEVEKGNAYVDEAVEEILRKHGDTMDPYEMEEYIMSIKKKIFMMEVSGAAKFHKCYMTGLKTLHRSGDCKLEREGDQLKITADLAAGEITYQCSGSVSFMSAGVTVKCEGTLDYVQIMLKMTVDEKTGRKGRLQYLSIGEMKGMKVQVTGLGPISWAMTVMINSMKYFFQRTTKYIVEVILRKHVADYIRENEFPVGDGGKVSSPTTVKEVTSVNTGNEISTEKTSPIEEVITSFEQDTSTPPEGGES